MERKKRYKLYKQRKRWCVLALSFGIISLGLAQNANADETPVSDMPKASVIAESSTNNAQMQTNSGKIAETATSQSQNNPKNEPRNDTPSLSVQPQANDTKDQTPLNGWHQDQSTKQWTYYTNGQTTQGRDYVNLPTINGQGNNWYLVDNGTVLSGVQQWAGTYYYFDPSTYLRVDHNYVQSQWGDWYMFGNDGRIVSGLYDWMGSTYYFDPVTYLKVTNHYLSFNGESHYFDNSGIMQEDPLVRQWKTIINGYANNHHILIALQSQKDGAIHEYASVPGYRLPTASIVKVAILAQLLHNTSGNLNSYQQELARKMIQNSDNNAADILVDRYLGGTSNMQAIYSALGMTQTTPGQGNHWARTLTTATDQLKLLNEIFSNPYSSYLNDQSREYIKSLMGSVSGDQHWGISAGSSQYYLKNGWSAFFAPWTWYVNSIGFIPQGNNDGYSIAVLTDNNLPMSVGVNIIESIARSSKNYI
ncbi:serine hydrolase [Limosilactobacillus agrestis]|uniref:Serine hydrolase n=1 Tax=Limosilactobacillus agrestis TaxID=2759748 RepID=A0ABS8R5R3_9LACO|nr:serine hydrolase [Limosilactobacillus agrestis]MCD7130091.1 serine hydrolase [Limosilactobacillus agrestis]